MCDSSPALPLYCYFSQPVVYFENQSFTSFVLFDSRKILSRALGDVNTIGWFFLCKVTNSDEWAVVIRILNVIQETKVPRFTVESLGPTHFCNSSSSE